MFCCSSRHEHATIEWQFNRPTSQLERRPVYRLPLPQRLLPLPVR